MALPKLTKYELKNAEAIKNIFADCQAAKAKCKETVRGLKELGIVKKLTPQTVLVRPVALRITFIYSPGPKANGHQLRKAADELGFNPYDGDRYAGPPFACKEKHGPFTVDMGLPGASSSFQPGVKKPKVKKAVTLTVAFDGSVRDRLAYDELLKAVGTTTMKKLLTRL